jgi:hypothetical protein
MAHPSGDRMRASIAADRRPSGYSTGSAALARRQATSGFGLTPHALCLGTTAQRLLSQG